MSRRTQVRGSFAQQERGRLALGERRAFARAHALANASSSGAPQPSSSAWVSRGVAPGTNGLAWAWDHPSGVRVLSSRVVAEYPDGDGQGLQDHVSVSRRGRRPADSDLRLALRAFGAEGWEEDGHHPGIARHFWRPLDPAHRVQCQCKADELVVVEPGGYTWTTPVDGPCRGCEYAATIGRLTGRRCPIHAPRDDGVAPPTIHAPKETP